MLKVTREVTRCKKEFDAAIKKAVKNRAARMTAVKAQSIVSNQAALNGLIAAHGELEKRKPHHLTMITQQLATMGSIIDAINDAQKGNAQKK